MSNQSAEPTDAGREENNGNAYLYESFTTEDGVVVPPPTRPMGPRRLTRYYDEVADYLRAVERGDEELPEAPMFMGKVEGLEKPTSSKGLDALSLMGNIDSGQEVEDVDPFALNVDFDNTRATVVEDPQADIVRQIFAGEENREVATAATANLATATPDIEGDGDFVALDDLAGEADENLEAGTIQDQVEADPETASATDSADPVAAIIARAQAKDEQKNGQKPASTADEEAKSAPTEDSETPVVTGIFAGREGAVAPALPQPVRAVEAQGLDLSALDAEDVTDLASQESSQVQGGRVESDSSSLIADAEESPAENGEETGEKTGQTEADDPAIQEIGENPNRQAFHSGEGLAPKKLTDDLPNDPGASASGYATALVEEEKKGNKAVVAIGILVLLAMFFLVWVFFLQ